MEKLLGKLFDSEGESCFSERSKEKHSSKFELEMEVFDGFCYTVLSGTGGRLRE